MSKKVLNYSLADMGARVGELMAERGHCQSELANMLGMNQSFISYLIRGRKGPTVDTLDRLCRALDTTPNYLMYGLRE